MSRATQWIALKRLGLSDTAAAVVMGHAMAESACEPNRVQGDSDPARTKSIVYTKWVDSGYVTRDEFIRNGPNGGGYGWLAVRPAGDAELSGTDGEARYKERAGYLA